MLSKSLLTTLAAAGLVVGCSSSPKIDAVAVQPATVRAGGQVAVTVTGQNLELDTATAAASLAGLRAAHGDGEAMGMHLHAYLDTTDQNPLVMTMYARFAVTIPAATSPGAHTLIVRLHDAEHMIVTPEVKATAALTVTSTRS